MNPTIIKALTKAIAYNEHNGEPKSVKGKSGEMASIFQYTPPTWKAYSTEVLGKETPLDPNTESYVTAAKVGKWLEAGYTPEQVLSMWNAGSGEPNAWMGKFQKDTGSHHSGDPSKGVNAKYQVPFDVPGYVKKGMGYFNQFSKEDGGQEQQQQQGVQQDPQREQAIATLRQIVNKYSTGGAPKQAPAQPPAPHNNGLMGSLMNASPSNSQPLPQG